MDSSALLYIDSSWDAEKEKREKSFRIGIAAEGSGSG